jgi:hypothetical protein
MEKNENRDNEEREWLFLLWTVGVAIILSLTASWAMYSQSEPYKYSPHILAVFIPLSILIIISWLSILPKKHQDKQEPKR